MRDHFKKVKASSFLQIHHIVYIDIHCLFFHTQEMRRRETSLMEFLKIKLTEIENRQSSPSGGREEKAGWASREQVCCWHRGTQKGATHVWPAWGQGLG